MKRLMVGLTLSIVSLPLAVLAETPDQILTDALPEESQEQPHELVVDVEIPWAASVLTGTEQDGSILAAMSHAGDYFELWRVDNDRTTQFLEKHEDVGYHPDAIYWTDWRDNNGEEPVLLLVLEGAQEIQLWRWQEQQLELETAVPTLFPVRDVGIGDINNDGLTDLVVGTYDEDPLQVLISHGDFTFDSLQLDVKGVALHPRLVDWDTDGDMDIVWSGYKNGLVRVALQKDGAMAVSAEESDTDTTTSASSPDTADSGGATNTDTDAEEPPGVFEIQTLWPTDVERSDARPRMVVAAELNGDDAPDLVVATEVGGGAWILYNDGEGKLARKEKIPSKNRNKGFNWAAVDGRGEEALLALGSFEGVTLVRREDNTWIRRLLAMDDMPIILDLQFVDVDADGHQDLVFAVPNRDQVRVVFGPLWERATPLDASPESSADNS